VYALEKAPGKDFFFSGSGDNYVTRWNVNEATGPEAVIKAQSTVYSLCLIEDKTFWLLVNQQARFTLLT
jgi:hypothetical protein